MSDSQPQPASSKYWSLDIFRGLCALAVFLSHLHLWSFFPTRSAAEEALRRVFDVGVFAFDWLTWRTGGQHPAVIGFLVLSGFCIHLSVLRAQAKDGRVAWGDYFRRRLVRILPVYWCGAALGLLFVVLQTTAPVPDATLALNARADIADVVVRFAGLSALYPHELLVGNGILNYVSVELMLYLGYPLLFLLRRRPRAWTWPCIFVLAAAGQVAAYLVAPFTTPFWAYYTPHMLGLFFVLGAGLAERWFHGRPAPAWKTAAVVWIVFIACRQFLSFPGLNLLLQLLWALVCACVLSGFLKAEKNNPGLVARATFRRLVRVGEVSFSLYVVHAPVMFISAWLIYRFAPAPNYALQVATAGLGSATLTALVYHLVERRRIRSRARAQA